MKMFIPNVVNNGNKNKYYGRVATNAENNKPIYQVFLISPYFLNPIASSVYIDNICGFIYNINSQKDYRLSGDSKNYAFHIYGGSLKYDTDTTIQRIEIALAGDKRFCLIGKFITDNVLSINSFKYNSNKDYIQGDVERVENRFKNILGDNFKMQFLKISNSPCNNTSIELTKWIKKDNHIASDN